MERFIDSAIISKDQVFTLCSKVLCLYDNRLIDHGGRVALIANKICATLYPDDQVNRKNLFLLALFHDIGAYKVEEIDRMLEFESRNVVNHSLYGYLFLKYFSPLAPMSKVLLYHHTSNEAYDKFDFSYKEYANLIHLADRIDVAMAQRLPKEKIISLIRNKQFCQQQVNAFEKILYETSLYAEITDKAVDKYVLAAIRNLPISLKEAISYLKMLVFTIDFKSPTTLDHSLNTAIISIFIAKNMNMPPLATEKLYFAALVHDLGKVAIPTAILEYPGRLNTEQMQIMKRHVLFTQELLADVIEQEVINIAVRHHEKLDGSGYPYGLLEKNLTPSDRILAVADIVSALVSKRSYKDKFNKMKTLAILADMVQSQQLDKDIVQIIKDNYVVLMALLDEESKPLREIYQKIQNEHKNYLNICTSAN